MELSKLVKTTNDWALVKNIFEGFGYNVLDQPDIEDNNPDMIIVSNKRSFNIEIKHARKKEDGVIEVDKISQRQIQKTDIVAVVFPNDYVFIEKINDYLKSTSEGGRRYFTYLNPLGSSKKDRNI